MALPTCKPPKAVVRFSQWVQRSSTGRRPATSLRRAARQVVEQLESRRLLSTVGVPPITVTEGQQFNGPVNFVTVANLTRPTTDFSATIQWGDGTSSAGTITQPNGSGSAYEISGTHTWNRSGGLPVTVTFHDNTSNTDSLSDVDVSQFLGSEGSPTIAVNPLNPLQIFVASDSSETTSLFGLGDQVGTGPLGIGFPPFQTSSFGILAAFSLDGGATWNQKFIADGSDNLTDGGADVKLNWDSFGNLFIAYLNTSDTNIGIAVSTDAGQNFTPIDSPLPVVTGLRSVDEPQLATGPGINGVNGSVWISFKNVDGNIAMIGAPVSGLGGVGNFGGPETVDNSILGNYADVAIGPKGQVTLVYQSDPGSAPNTLLAVTDPDGLGIDLITSPVTVSNTNVTGTYVVPPQQNRTIDAAPSLAWDRSGGVHNGRLYLTYVDTADIGSADTNIFLRHSDDLGVTWTAPVRVNDDTGSATQFLPDIAIDQATGNLAVAWYDGRNSTTNTTVQEFAAISSDGGFTFAPNQQLSSGSSNAGLDLDRFGQEEQYGNSTDIAFVGQTLYPVWVGNALLPVGNLDTPNFDVITTQVLVAQVQGPAITGTGTTTNALLNDIFTGTVGTFVDANPIQPLSELSASINWGDGTISPGFITRSGNNLTVVGSHQYALSGAQNVTVVLSQTVGASVQVSSVVNVTPVTLLAEFGVATGIKHPTVKLAPDANGTVATLTVTGGDAKLFREDTTGLLDLSITGNNVAVTLTTKGGTKRVSFDNITINGRQAKLNIAPVDLVGTLYVNSPVSKAVLGNVMGTVAAAGPITTLQAISFTNARVITFANLGDDAQVGGGGNAGDVFQAGALTTLKATKGITNSFFGVGIAPGADGVFGTSDDLFLGGRLGTVTAGTIDSLSRFEAGAFKSASAHGKINVKTDPRFIAK